MTKHCVIGKSKLIIALKQLNTTTPNNYHLPHIFHFDASLDSCTNLTTLPCSKKGSFNTEGDRFG